MIGFGGWNFGVCNFEFGILGFGFGFWSLGFEILELVILGFETWGSDLEIWSLGL